MKNPGKDVEAPTIHIYRIFHPNVSPTGKVSIILNDMKAENNRMETYIAFLTAMLSDPNTSDPNNHEAGKLFRLF